MSAGSRAPFVAVALAAALAACGSGTPAAAPRAEAAEDGLDSARGAGPSAAAPPRSDEVRRGVEALERGDARGARAAFEEATKKTPADAHAHYYLGVAREKDGDRPGAEDAYRKALALDGKLEEAHENLLALLVDAKRFGDAAVAGERASKVLPKSVPVWLNLALARAGQGDAAGAAAAFAEAERAGPKDGRVPLVWAEELVKQRKLAEAAEKLRAAARLVGEDVGLLAAVGFEQKNAGAFTDCVTTLDRAIGLRDAAELRTYRALCKLGAKDAPAARADLEAAIAAEPRYAPAHYYLAGRLAEAGQLAEAEKGYRTYLELAPEGPLAASAKERAKLAHERAGAKGAPPAPKKR